MKPTLDYISTPQVSRLGDGPKASEKELHCRYPVAAHLINLYSLDTIPFIPLSGL